MFIIVILSPIMASFKGESFSTSELEKRECQRAREQFLEQCALRRIISNPDQDDEWGHPYFDEFDESYLTSSSASASASTFASASAFAFASVPDDNITREREWRPRLWNRAYNQARRQLLEEVITQLVAVHKPGSNFVEISIPETVLITMDGNNFSIRNHKILADASFLCWFKRKILFHIGILHPEFFVRIICIEPERYSQVWVKEFLVNCGRIQRISTKSLSKYAFSLSSDQLNGVLAFMQDRKKFLRKLAKKQNAPIPSVTHQMIEEMIQPFQDSLHSAQSTDIPYVMTRETIQAKVLFDLFERQYNEIHQDIEIEEEWMDQLEREKLAKRIRHLRSRWNAEKELHINYRGQPQSFNAWLRRYHPEVIEEMEMIEMDRRY